MKKISKLTEKQKSQIPVFIDKWVKLASRPVDKNKAKKAIEDMYKAMGENNPIVIIGNSPANAFLLNILFFTLIKNIKSDQLHGQLYDQLHGQLYGQLRGQLYGQLYDQLDGQLRGQLDGQLYDQLHGQLHGQLDGQLYGQLDGQLHGQLDGQLYDQLDGQLHGQLGSFYLSYFWYDWAGLYDYGKYIGVKYNNKKMDLFFNFIVECHFVLAYKGVAFISEKPQINFFNRRLHSLTGKSIEYPDGWGLYNINGVKFDKELWKKITNKIITPEEAIKLPNVEQRIIAIQYIGGERLLKELSGKIISQDEYGEIWELEKLQDTNKKNYRYYVANDPSKNEKVYLRTHPDVTTPKEAMTRAYRLHEFKIEYNPIKRT